MNSLKPARFNQISGNLLLHDSLEADHLYTTVAVETFR